jgi:hypothetical protein
MIQTLADWLFADAWQQCAARYEYAAKTFKVTNDA